MERTHQAPATEHQEEQLHAAVDRAGETVKEAVASATDFTTQKIDQAIDAVNATVETTREKAETAVNETSAFVTEVVSDMAQDYEQTLGK